MFFANNNPSLKQKTANWKFAVVLFLSISVYFIIQILVFFLDVFTF